MIVNIFCCFHLIGCRCRQLNHIAAGREFTASDVGNTAGFPRQLRAAQTSVRTLNRTSLPPPTTAVLTITMPAAVVLRTAVLSPIRSVHLPRHREASVSPKTQVVGRHHRQLSAASLSRFHRPRLLPSAPISVNKNRRLQLQGKMVKLCL